MELEAEVAAWLQHRDPQRLSAPGLGTLAARIVEQLKREADQHWAIDPRVSLALAAEIEAIGQARGEASTVALGSMARGDALKFMGRNTEAWEALEQAGQLFHAAGDEVGWARTCIGRLYLSPKLNRITATLAEAARARKVFNIHHRRELRLRLDLNTALLHSSLGNQHQALACYASALATAQALGADGEAYLGPLFTNIGLAYGEMGDLHQALAHYERARGLFAAQSAARSLAVVELNIANIAQAQGRYRHALRLLHAVLERDVADFAVEAALIRWGLVACYLSLNRYAEAHALIRQVVADYRASSDTYELARALLYVVEAEAALGHPAEAQAALEEAESLLGELGATTWLAVARLWRGRLALQQGDYAAAQQAAAAAANAFASPGYEQPYAMAVLLDGQAALAGGDAAGACAAGVRALAVAQRVYLPGLRYSAHLLLGQAAEAAGQPTRAVRRYRAAAATVDRVQRHLTLTLRPGFLTDKGEALRRLIGQRLVTGQAQAAFETLECSKSQVLLGYLADQGRLRWSRETAHSQALIHELDRLRAEHQWFYNRAHEPPTAPARESTEAAQRALAEVAGRERRMRAITEQLYLESDEGGLEHPAGGVSVAALQGRLDEATVLVEYYNDGQQWWAFTLTSTTLAVRRLPANVAAVDRLVEQLQVNLEAALALGPQTPGTRLLQRTALGLLQRLHSLLVAPLALAPQAAQRLIVVPFGSLHYLPFQALYDGSAYLIERAEVVVVPAAGLLTRAAPPPRAGALILAYSQAGRLPQTNGEAALVQALFGGQLYEEEAATLSALQTAPRQLLHIAAHGHYRLDQPDLSYIQLAGAQVYADDLLQHDLSYELVTLSACETGRAKVAPGDELIGLGRGFLYAGAGALLASLWNVGDAVTLAFMQRFYEGLRAGTSKAAALRQAQRALLDADRQLHPAFWGAFQLIGNAEPLSAYAP